MTNTTDTEWILDALAELREGLAMLDVLAALEGKS